MKRQEQIRTDQELDAIVNQLYDMAEHGQFAAARKVLRNLSTGTEGITANPILDALKSAQAALADPNLAPAYRDTIAMKLKETIEKFEKEIKRPTPR